MPFNETDKNFDENLAKMLNPNPSLTSRTTTRLRNLAKKAINRAVLTVGGFIIYAQTRAVVEWKKSHRKQDLEDLITGTSIIGFEVSGEEGEIKTVREWPEEWFKPEKLIVTETTPDNEVRLVAKDTILVDAFVGAHSLFESVPNGSSGIHCSVFGSDRLGTVVMWTRPCHLGQSITLQIKFLKKCTWRGSLHGRFDRDGIMRRRKS